MRIGLSFAVIAGGLLLAVATIANGQNATSKPAARVRVAIDLELKGQPFGTIVLELDGEKAPITSANFIRYVDDGYYNNTVIHRIAVNDRLKVLQGGGYIGLGQTTKPGQHPPIKNEANNGLSNVRGTIAMARDSDPDSATSEFFINIEDNKRLDYVGPEKWGYCVFGRVVEGLDVVDKIKALETKTNPDPELKGEKSLPVEAPVVKKARRL